MAIPQKNSWNDSDVETHWDKVAPIYVRENNRVKATHDQRFRESVSYLQIKPGMKVSLTVLHEGETKKIDVIVGVKPKVAKPAENQTAKVEGEEI